MQSRYLDEEISLALAIERLQSNDPKWDCLNFSKILINPRLVHLDDDEMVVSHITDDDLIELAAALTTNTTLSTFEFNGTDSTRSLEWTALGASAIGQALKDHPNLSNLSIDLTTFDITENEIIGFLEALTGKAAIRNLRLSVYCISNEFILNLGDILLQNTKLNRIYIQGQSLQNNLPLHSDSVKKLAEGLAFQKNLKSLTLYSLNLGDSGATHLVSPIAGMNLSKLTLDKVGLSAEGIRELAPAIELNRELTHLNFGNNRLGLPGLQALMLGLPSLIFLESLDLDDTKLDHEAIHYLAREWRRLKLSISNLSLASNKITEESIAAIHHLIDGNSSLRELRLDFCELSSEQLGVLAPLLSNAERCHLELFSFGGSSPFILKDYRKIAEILERNRLIQLYPPLHHENIRKGNHSNKENILMKHQQRCLNQIIQIANAYTALTDPSKPSLLSNLPFDTILAIIFMLYGDNIKGINIDFSSRLILENFIMRRKLINENVYDHEEKEPEIKKWWKTSLEIVVEGRPQTKMLFQANPRAALFYKDPSRAAILYHEPSYQEPEELKLSPSDKPLPSKRDRSNCRLM